MRGSVYKFAILVLLCSLVLIFKGEYAFSSNVSSFPRLMFDKMSEGLILISTHGSGEYRFYSLETEGVDTIEVNVKPHESGAYELLVVYNTTILENGRGLNVSIEMSFLLYRGNLYYGDKLIGFSPFLFDIPITFDYLLKDGIDPKYLWSSIDYPDKPVRIIGSYGLEVILLMSNNVIEASKVGDVDSTSVVSLPIYKAEVRGRIPLLSMFVIPSYLLPSDVVDRLISIVEQATGIEGLEFSYIFLDMILSQEFVDRYRDLIIDESVCIDLCPTTQIDFQAVLTLVMLIVVVLLVFYIRRR